MFCGKCGKEINNSLFCPFCGFKQEIKEEESINELNDLYKELKNIKVKNFIDYDKKEFINLKINELTKIIINQISKYKKEDKSKAYFIEHVILKRFNSNYYKDNEDKLYDDLKFENYSKDLQRLTKQKLRPPIKDSSLRRYRKIIFHQFIVSSIIDLFIFKSVLNIFPFLQGPDLLSNFLAFILIAIVSWVSLQIYLAPWNIAWARRHPSAWGILIVNLLLSWTFIAWVIALIWALSQTEQRIVIRD